MAEEKERICKNCWYSFIRSHFDLEKYGNRGFPYECDENTKARYPKYVRLDDTCDKFKPKKEEIMDE